MAIIRNSLPKRLAILLPHRCEKRTKSGPRNKEHGRTSETFRSNPPRYDHLVFEVDEIAAAKTWLESHGIAAGSIEDVTIPGIGAFQYLRFKDPEGNLLGLRQPVTQSGK